MPVQIVNNNQPIKNTYYHCFKLSDSSYALFDAKMDMPIVVGSTSIIQSTRLNSNSLVFEYKLNSRSFFEKQAKLYFEMNKSANGYHKKQPLRYHYINPNGLFYHLFKLTNVSWSLFDMEFDMPLAYGGLSKVQAVLNHINENAVVFYYQKDTVVKDALKIWYVYRDKKIKYLQGR